MENICKINAIKNNYIQNIDTDQMIIIKWTDNELILIKL